MTLYYFKCVREPSKVCLPRRFPSLKLQRHANSFSSAENVSVRFNEAQVWQTGKISFTSYYFWRAN